MANGTGTSEYLKINMADAIFELLVQKPLEKITVADIVGTAGVGRTTWFRSFATKRDAISFRLARIVKSRLSAQSDDRVALVLGEADGKLLRLLFSRGLERLVYEALVSAFASDSASPAEHLAAGGKAGAAFGMIAEWVQLPCTVTVAELNSMLVF